MKNKILTVTAILLILGGAGLGVFWFIKNRKQNSGSSGASSSGSGSSSSGASSSSSKTTTTAKGNDNFPLKKGSVGTRVKVLQGSLNGYFMTKGDSTRIGVDGIWGDETQLAFEKWAGTALKQCDEHNYKRLTGKA